MYEQLSIPPPAERRPSITVETQELIPGELMIVCSVDADTFVSGHLKEKRAFIEYINVPEAKKGKGLGTKMVERFISEARTRGAEMLGAELAVEGSQKIFQKIFGDDVLQHITDRHGVIEIKL